jgi:hypothetical protein
VSLDLHTCTWHDWLVDEVSSLPYNERVEVLIGALNHSSSMASLKMSRELSKETRFRLAETMRDAADRLERICPNLD